MKVYTEENPLVVFKMLHADGSAPWGKGKWSLPNGKREMPAACWDFYRVPDLSFEVYPALDALDRKVRP